MMPACGEKATGGEGLPWWLVGDDKALVGALKRERESIGGE
jgi:hypothetical protein